MEVLKKLAVYIQSLDRKQLQKYTLFFLLAVAMVIGTLTYYLYSTQVSLVKEIYQLHALANKSLKIVEENRKMSKEEQRLRDILEKDRSFTIKGFFEQFCKEQDIVPERGWDSSAQSVNEKFDEIALTATFKGQTTEKLVKILTALDQKEIVYIKELVVRNENNGKITFDITIATKQDKAIIE